MQEERKFQLLQALIEIQEHFYTRRGVELHDKVAQLLGSVNMLLGVAMKDIQQLSDTLNVAQASLSTAMQELRMLSKPMQSAWMSGFNAQEHLQYEITRINAAGHARVTMISNGQLSAVPGEKQAMLFCILLEVLQTITGYAQSKEITIKIVCEKQVEVLIRDDGNNLYPLPENIQTRIQSLDGNLQYTHTAKGNILQIQLPA